LAERDDFIHSIEGYKLILTVFDDMDALTEAVKYIEENKPNLVLLDYFLGPGGCASSLDVLEKIVRCCAGASDVQIVSGMHPEDLRLRLAKKALIPMHMGIIQKPFSIEELVEVIRKSVHKR